MEKLLSIGIDIGTSTTQLILSELMIQNTSSSFTIPSISIVDKKIKYESDIIFTPISSDNLIDTEKIQAFVSDQYKKAGVKPADIETGAIIITGETVRKENSRAVAEALSNYAGDFVVATAGPDLESIIAGKGSGAHSYSSDNHCRTMNFDIGGGTTNVVVFDDGVTVDTACFDIGGRLIRVGQDQVIQYISPKYEEIIRKEQLNLEVGKKVDMDSLNKLFEVVIQVIENIAGIGEKSQYFDHFITNKSFADTLDVDYISFSGGVADFIDESIQVDNAFAYGDIGILFGQAIRQSRIYEAFTVIKSVETIRATVVGAGSHTTSVSGSTIMYEGEIFPLKNVPVIKFSSEEENSKDFSEIIKKKLKWFEVESEKQMIAVAFNGKKNPKYKDIVNLSKSLIEGMKSLVEDGFPVIIIVKEDMAKALGYSMFSLLPDKYNLVCIDNVIVNEGDYIDIGKPISDGQVLPLVIKSLVFN